MISNFGSLNATFENSTFVVFGCGFDGTTSFRPGTRFAPMTMRADFFGLERYSPLLNKDYDDAKVFDRGDIELLDWSPASVLDSVYQFTRNIYFFDKVPVMIGGEHLLTLASVRAAYEKYPDLTLIQLDAHTDLRDSYLGSEISHATVIKKIWNFLGDKRIYQFGIRSGTKEEFLWAEDHVYLHKFDFKNIDIIKNINTKVYITLDLDVLDPSVFPGTGTPEPGGVLFSDLERFFKLMENLDIVGFDIVEFSPHYDFGGISSMVACKALREMVLSSYKEKESE